MTKEFGTPAYMLRRNEDPETSHEAAAQVDTTYMEHQIYLFVSNFKHELGCTVHQVIEKSGLHPWRVSPRLIGLERKKFIYYQGDTRSGPSNRQQRVIRIERRKKDRGFSELRSQDAFAFTNPKDKQ